MKSIILQNVSKKFVINKPNTSSFLAMISELFVMKKTMISVNNVSLTVNKGEMFGIVGKNGSGKSTLLRLISKIYYPDSGSINTAGRIVPLIGIQTGLDSRLTGRDNVFLYGCLIGMTRKEIKKRYNSIVKFAELEDFMSSKLRKFSEGMKERLSFSIAIHADPDILLLDEVLAVGDEDFKKKCMKVIREFLKKKKTIVFVSHDLDVVKKYCDRVALMQNGKIINVGTPNKIIHEYLC